MHGLTAKDELLPCPFCGKRPLLIGGGEEGEGFCVFHECVDGLGLEFGWFGDKEWAVSAWNRRQAIAATVGRDAEPPTSVKVMLPREWQGSRPIPWVDVTMPDGEVTHLVPERGECREVYLLVATDIGNGREEVLGVYATEEAAMVAINENQFGYEFHHVRKWEVDA